MKAEKVCNDVIWRILRSLLGWNLSRKFLLLLLEREGDGMEGRHLLKAAVTTFN